MCIHLKLLLYKVVFHRAELFSRYLGGQHNPCGPVGAANAAKSTAAFTTAPVKLCDNHFPVTFREAKMVLTEYF